jgi:enolase
MSKIQSIIGRQVLDSRGFPTTEAEVFLSDGTRARAMVPSGASTGEREAIELRDGDNAVYMGKGVLKAVEHINSEIAQSIKGISIEDLSAIDQILIELDGTPDKSRLGANAVLAASLACAHAKATQSQKGLCEVIDCGVPKVLPTPMLNVLNGGKHADNNVDIQEFMIVPHGADTFAQALQMGVEIYHALKNVLRKKGMSCSVGDEGGFAPNLRSNEEAIHVLLEAIERTPYALSDQVSLALDCAASEYYVKGAYELAAEGRTLSAEQMVEFLSSWVDQYPIISIEDGMDENDHDGWKQLTQKLGDRLQLVGDDLFVTNPDVFSSGIEKGLANSILIKVNQIGTLSETLKTVYMAQQAGYSAVMSHRSGETEDTTIADLAVATGVGQIKTGAPCRSDRVAKYNQLLRIEEAFGFPYAGKRPFKVL